MEWQNRDSDFDVPECYGLAECVFFVNVTLSATFISVPKNKEAQNLRTSLDGLKGFDFGSHNNA